MGSYGIFLPVNLDTPDLCAHLDRLKALCDRLEEVQDDPRKYHVLVEQIRSEAEAFREMVCNIRQPKAAMESERG
jgi:hypothetical protein